MATTQAAAPAAGDGAHPHGEPIIIAGYGSPERGAAKKRPRGFAPWTPRPETLRLLNRVRDIVAEYRAYVPLTLRQIFYRLVGAHGYEKTEQAYDGLGETLNRARRARLLAMDVIRDDGGQRIGGQGFRDADAFVDGVISDAKYLRLDCTAGQKVRVVVMCEAAGMVPQLASVADEYNIDVQSSGGFESLTEKHEFASRVARDDRPTEVLHVGDHDASGVHIVGAMADDVQAFVAELGGSVRFTRLAVTPEQVAVLGLPTAPPKPTDRRAFHGYTTQAEAIPPDVLAAILGNAIQARVDSQVLQRVLAEERRLRAELPHRLEAIRNTRRSVHGTLSAGDPTGSRCRVQSYAGNQDAGTSIAGPDDCGLRPGAHRRCRQSLTLFPRKTSAQARLEDLDRRSGTNIEDDWSIIDGNAWAKRRESAV